jgi:hypothetical protein
MYVNGNMPNQGIMKWYLEHTMAQIYDKYKD